MLYQFFLRVRIKHINVVAWKIILKFRSASATFRSITSFWERPRTEKNGDHKAKRLKVFIAYPQAEWPPSAVLSSLQGHACFEPQL